MMRRENKSDPSNPPALGSEPALTFLRIAEAWANETGKKNPGDTLEWLYNAFLKGEFERLENDQTKSDAVLHSHHKGTQNPDTAGESSDSAGEYTPITREVFIRLTGDVVYSSVNYRMYEGVAKTYFKNLGVTKEGLDRFCHKLGCARPAFWFKSHSGPDEDSAHRGS